MFKQRLISGIILVIIAFVTLYYGGFLTFFVVGAISLIGVFELLSDPYGEVCSWCHSIHR